MDSAPEKPCFQGAEGATVSTESLRQKDGVNKQVVKQVVCYTFSVSLGEFAKADSLFYDNRSLAKRGFYCICPFHSILYHRLYTYNIEEE